MNTLYRLLFLFIAFGSLSSSSAAKTWPQFKDVFDELPYYTEYVALMRMKMSRPVATANGGKSNLVFASAGQADNNIVEYIYFIPNGYNSKLTHINPPKVRALTYHNLGGDKDFCGLTIESYRRDSTGDFRKMVREVRIDDDTANILIDLIAGDSDFYNKTDIEFEETSSPHLRENFYY